MRNNKPKPKKRPKRLTADEKFAQVIVSGVDADQWPNVRVRLDKTPKAQAYTTLERDKMLTVSVPDTKDFYARTVRVHELLHAKYSYTEEAQAVYEAELREFGERTHQVTEDMHLHLNCWPQQSTVTMYQDSIKTAKADLDSVKDEYCNHGVKGKQEAFPQLLRAAAILHTARDRGVRSRALGLPKWIEPRHKRVIEQINALVRTGNPNHRKEAAELIAILLGEIKPKPQPGDPNGDKPGDKSGDDKTLDKGSHGNGNCVYRLVELPLVQRVRNAQVERVTVSALTGRRIKQSRLARAVVDPTTRVFKRVKMFEGGCVLIDASGSMHMSAQALHVLTECLPFATIAYYYGYGYKEETGVWGDLVIAARNGRRAAETPINSPNNCIDYAALQWLDAQPGSPKWYVGDRQFCGGPHNQDQRAHMLLDHMIEDSGVIVYSSVEAAVQAARKLARR